MVKLGEGARLGEEQLAEPAEIELIDDDVEERAKDVIKSAFPTHEGTTWDQILDVILYEFRVEHAIAQDILEERYINSADGEQLDKIGELWQVERRRFERDASLRARIKTMFPRHTSRATLDEVIHTLSLLLDTEDNKVTIEDNFWHEPARFDVYIEQDAFDEADLSISELETLLDDVSAAGVRPVIQVGAQFTHTGMVITDDGTVLYGNVVMEPDSENSGEPYGEYYGGTYGGLATEVEGHDEDKGYGSLDDPMLGGEYADLSNIFRRWTGEMRNNRVRARCYGFMMVHGHDFPDWENQTVADTGPNELFLDARGHPCRLRSASYTADGTFDGWGHRRRVRRWSQSGEMTMFAGPTLWTDAYDTVFTASVDIGAGRLRRRMRPADFAGVATQTANAATNKAISASFECYGWLSPNSANEINRATALSASATIDAAGLGENNRNASIDPTLEIDAEATIAGYGSQYGDDGYGSNDSIHHLSTFMNGSADITATPSMGTEVSATIEGSADITASPDHTVGLSASAPISGSAQISAVSEPSFDVTASASLTGTADVTAADESQSGASASMTGTADITVADSVVDVSASASMSGSADVSVANSVVGMDASASMDGSADVAVANSVIGLSASTSMTGTAEIVAVPGQGGFGLNYGYDYGSG